jgi:hypothetical protein
MPDFIPHIPSAKFSHPNSCYSFIVRFAADDSFGEIYFPPEVTIAQDFNAFLNQHKFRLHPENLQLWRTVFFKTSGKKRKAAIADLLNKAKSYGAYQVSAQVKLAQLPDRHNPNSPTAKNQDLATIVADKINTLLAAKLDEASGRSRAIIEDYQEEVASLKQVISEKDKLIQELKEQGRKHEQDLFKLREYERILGIVDTANTSPFTVVVDSDTGLGDIIHLNSPFQGGDLEILDPAHYDEDGYNHNIAPANFTASNEESEGGGTPFDLPSGASKAGTISLEEIDLGLSVEDLAAGLAI